MTKDFFRVGVTKQSSNRRNMALESSFFGIRFSQKQLKIRPMSSNKRLPCELNCGFARSSSPWNSRRRGKKIRQNPNYYQNRGERTKRRTTNHKFRVSCATYSPSFHYDGNITRHLEARNNQSAMRNQPTWYTFPIQSSTIHGWMRCDPQVLFGRKLPFLILAIILKPKKSVLGKF